MESQPQAEARIALCIYNYPWTMSPSILNSAQLLAEAGYAVDILVRQYPDLPFTLGHENVAVLALESGNEAGRGEVLPEPLPGPRRLLRRLLPDRLYIWLAGPRRIFWSLSIEYHWFQAMRRYAVWLQRQCRERRYVALIGMDRTGLIPAMWAGMQTATPVIYYSLEIQLSGEDTSLRAHLLKRLERWAHRRATWTIIQDGDRAAHLARDNGVDMANFVLVPVAALGSAVTEKTACLQDRLGIPAGKVLVLSAGGIADCNLCLELAQAAQSWPDEWVLVIHGYVPDPAYLRDLYPLCSSGKVYLSTDLVPYQDLDALLASADIGVALYKDLGPNFRHIVLSSGKLAQYLKVGLPVIATAFPGVEELMAAEQCGVAVHTVAELPSAIAQILSMYEQYRQCAFACYRKHYDLRAYFDEVLRRLETHSQVV